MKTLSFEGNGWEYFKVWIVNILLVVVTLGIYYPWAKVRNNRYFYANTTLDERSFDYHATGKQLFIGYLIAMGLFVTYVLVQNISPIGSLVLLFAFFLAFPWIVWRSLKFNLLMTSFSNVRFSFAGQLGNAYINYLLLPIAFFLALYGVPIILAVIIPMFGASFNAVTGVLIALAVVAFLALAFYLFAYMKKRNTCYAINGFRYGQGEFATTVETKGFAIISLKTLGLGLVIMIVFMLIIAAIAIMTIGLNGLVAMQQGMSDPQAIEEMMSGGLLLIIGPVYIGMIAASFFIMAYAYARQRTYIFGNSKLDENISFNSTLRARSVAWVMITNFLAVIVSLGLAFPWAKVRMARLVLNNTQINSAEGFDAYVTQMQDEQSPLGEQIGDAFDVDVGVGI